MSTQISGDPTVLAAALPVPVAIASSTNATPIVVTTAAPHGINSGDYVQIDGHATNTAANGYHVAGTVTATTVVLAGTVGVGVGGATGTALSCAPGPTFTVPSDLTDDMAAASVNVAFEALADRTALFWLGLIRMTPDVAGLQEDTTLPDATPQTIGNRFAVYHIPATLTANTTINLLAGISDGRDVVFIRDPSPDSHTVTISTAGGNTYVLAGSTAGWIRLFWRGSSWISIGNGSGWTGTHVLV